ncbi:DUF2301 domain-containing membrane protein [Leptodesmis sp.]|uniref:DUF2301 domain-containing membrane protein n=1 Tax=Leptodesmis sp. TaxID=3100501 RepID=UPI00405355F9
MTSSLEPGIYQGQFGEFTITERDRWEVIVYRSGLVLAAGCFVIGTGLVLGSEKLDSHPHILSWLYSGFCLGLGVSLWTIHIYMKLLHRVLQVFWGIGVVASLAIAHGSPAPFALTVYNYPLTIFGVGFVFAALTGIFFKEAFCFDRLETKLLTPLIPVLLLGHLLGWLSLPVERVLLAIGAGLFVVFALRKAIQPIPPDIGDKSIFAYLKQKQ